MTMTFDDMFAPAYRPDARDRAIFGDAYTPPPLNFEHSKWHTVARLPKAGGDGQAVEIDEARWPARFFRLRALPDVTTVGTRKRGFTINTGSGDDMGVLMMSVANALANGMLSFNRDDAHAE